MRRLGEEQITSSLQVLEEIEDPEEKHDKILDAYRESTKKIIRETRKQSKPLIDDETWKKVNERKEATLNLESTKSQRLKQRRREEYHNKDMEVKRSAREDMRNWMEERADAAEKAAENSRNKEM